MWGARGRPPTVALVCLPSFSPSPPCTGVHSWQTPQATHLTACHLPTLAPVPGCSAQWEGVGRGLPFTACSRGSPGRLHLHTGTQRPLLTPPRFCTQAQHTTITFIVSLVLTVYQILRSVDPSPCLAATGLAAACTQAATTRKAKPRGRHAPFLAGPSTDGPEV